MKAIKLLTLAMLALVGTASATAQSTSGYPYVFVGVQGGGQLTFTNYDHTKLITPIGAAQVGAMWTPIVGTRLHVSGIHSKVGVPNVGEYKFKYVTSDFDVLFNLTNLWRNADIDNRIDVYALCGFGLNYNWNHQPAFNTLPENHFAHNFRVGLATDFNICRNFSVGLEVNANNLADRFNSKLNGKDDWQVTAMIGLTYKFRCNNAPAPAPVVCPEPVQPAPAPVQPAPEPMKPEPQPVIEPEPAPAPAPAPKVLEKTSMEVFFAINSTEITDAEKAKVAAFAEWLKQHPEVPAIITGYADAGTGTSAINRRLSQGRVNKVKDMLIREFGIDAKRISSDAKGDTMQPKVTNEKNRLVIGIAEEK